MNLYLIPHPRVKIAAVAAHWTADEALAACRRDDPCWNEIEISSVQNRGFVRAEEPTLRFIREGDEIMETKNE